MIFETVLAQVATLFVATAFSIVRSSEKIAAGFGFNRKRSIQHRNRGICYRDDRPTILASPFSSGELANRRDVVCFPDREKRLPFFLSLGAEKKNSSIKLEM